MSFRIIFCVLASVIFSKSQDIDYTSETADQLLHECIGEFTIDVSTVIAAFNYEIVEDQNLKCALNCWVEAMGFLKNGVASIEGIEQWLPVLYHGDDIPIAIQIDTACASAITSTEECEPGYQFIYCVFAANKEAGIAPPDFGHHH